MVTKIRELENECIALEREGEDLGHMVEVTIQQNEAKREEDNRDHQEWVSVIRSDFIYL
jgi:hypothetical protein